MSVKGRPRSEEKRQRILQSAISLFLDKGFDGTSMDEIAVLAEVSKQTVYSHFKNKAELFVAAIEGKCEFHELSLDFFDDSIPCRDMLMEIAKRFTTMLLTEDAVRLHRTCIAEAEQHNTVCQLFFDAGPSQLIEGMANYLQRQADKGQMAIGNSRHAACQFLFMVKGEAHMKACLNISTPKDYEEADSYMRDCVEMFLNAYSLSKQ